MRRFLSQTLYFNLNFNYLLRQLNMHELKLMLWHLTLQKPHLTYLLMQRGKIFREQK